MNALRLPVYFPVLGVPTPPNYTDVPLILDASRVLGEEKQAVAG